MSNYVYRVKVLINLYLWYILNERLEFRVQCMICFILMQKAILLCVNWSNLHFVFVAN